MVKKLLSEEELIAHMKSKGIQFTIMTEDEAKLFLNNSNYYKKLSSYKGNYLRAPDKEQNMKYQDLEFAYLVELSKIDYELRYLIMRMCLDIEHFVKVWIINKAMEIGDDGFQISKEFLMRKPKVMDNVKMHETSCYCCDLIKAYKQEMPLYALLEVISFGDLCKLYKYVMDEYVRKTNETEVIFEVRELRNAVAHNQCLIRNLRGGNAKPNIMVTKFVSSIDEISKNARKVKLSNYLICDFVSLLVFYDKVVGSEGIKKVRYSELKNLFYNRILEHKDYFVKNTLLINTYDFCKKVVDKIIIFA